MTSHARVITTSAAEGLPRRRFTVAEVEAMVAAGIMEEDERVELIGGELVPMSPKGSRHERLKVTLNRRWCKLAPDDVEVAQETTFRLSVDTLLEPDFILAIRSLDVTAVTGTEVLLVVEIADSSRRCDMGRKAALYASFGVPELWVIDAVETMIRIFRDPSPDKYRETSDIAAKGTATPLLAPPVFARRLADLAIR